jgi:hypothetical protein
MKVTKEEMFNFIYGFAVVTLLFFALWQFGIFEMGAKPAIYLYPEHPMDVTVRVYPVGIFTKTIPEYKSGWAVHATPGGLIDGRYDYLFYETLTLSRFYSNVGWVVKAEDLSVWFDEYLPRLGLNGAEAAAMKEYWVAKLDKDGYYLITPLDDGMLARFSTLDIEPKPDTVIRVILNFKHLKEPVATEEPEVVTHARKGFTVVEWGGVTPI